MSKEKSILEKNVLNLFRAVQKANFGNFEWFFLSDLAQQVSLISGFQYLLSLEDINITHFPHQEEAVLQVLQQMQGSALLADEVGLGKTIIALTILSELKIRNLINTILIVTPSSLVNQWHQEIIEKYNIEIPVVASGRGNFNRDELITSIPILTRYSEKIVNKNWDLVIVDEAHRVKNRNTKGWQILNRLKKKYMLLLTATPMENYLKDIYNLVTLLKPIFGSYSQFKKKYSIPGNKRGCKDPIQLRRVLNQVMIRRKRDEIKGIFFPERMARVFQFDMNEAETNFYNTISEYVITNYAELEKIKANAKNISEKYNITSRRNFKRKVWLHRFTLMLLQRRLCSSAYAAEKTIMNMIKSREANSFDIDGIPTLQDFHTMASNLSEIESSKITNLKLILERIPEKCVIFTEFGDSLKYISKYLENEGYSYIKFSGALSSSKRAEVIKKFYTEKDILLSTDAGAEGLNLQVANTIINFDLPWNPMRIEQRIGRVYRLTQKSDKIFIFNLASKGTIEEYVLDILYEKIGIFRTILGDLNHILGSLVKSNADGRSAKIESEIMKFFVKNGHSERLRKDLELMIQPAVDTIETEESNSENVLDVDKMVDKY